jgi:hypothetical protein
VNKKGGLLCFYRKDITELDRAAYRQGFGYSKDLFFRVDKLRGEGRPDMSG